MALSLTPVAGIADDSKCAECHSKEVAGFAASAMAKSLTDAGPQTEGSFTHALSGTQFTLRSSPSGSTQTWSRAGDTSQQQVSYIVGSGSHALGYLIQIGDHLFQSPLSYYTKRREWDVAPGYEQSTAPDFSRPVTNECLLCHSGKPQPVADSLNRYQSPPFANEGITCERCHGSADRHLKRPVSGSIINPAKLSAAARDSVCEQCHLAGEVRIPNPGKNIADFHPGQALEDTFTVYTAAQGSEHAVGIKVVSHVEQLALSLCARSSGGKLWCGTCHDPHEQAKATPAAYREKCLNCHGASLQKSHAAPGRNCVACHMPTQPTRDGGHTAFTDHRIARRIGMEPSSSIAANSLVAWREPDAKFRDRNLGIALVTHGLQEASSDQVIRGYRLLNHLEKNNAGDAVLETSLGSVLLRAREPHEALRHFDLALKLRPTYAPYEVNVAAALKESGESAQAASHLERALTLDPLLDPAVKLLVGIYRQQGHSQKADQLLARYRTSMGIATVKTTESAAAGSSRVFANARE